MAGDVKNVEAVTPLLWSLSCVLGWDRSVWARLKTVASVAESSSSLWGTIWGARTAHDFT